MIPASRAGLIVLCSLFALEPAILSALPERSLSTSRQFVVYGPELRLRGAICDLAGRTKRDLLQLIDQRDDWVTPIVIKLEFPQANLPDAPRTALNFSQTGAGLKLQLDLTIALDVTHPRIRREILRAILLEMIYRGQPDVPAGTAYVPPPDWLLDGIPAQPSESPGLPDVLAAPVSAKKILSLTEFLRQRPELLESPGRSLYRAYSFALVAGPTGGIAWRASLGISVLPRMSRCPICGRIFRVCSTPTAARRKRGLPASRNLRPAGLINFSARKRRNVRWKNYFI
ncbi:MAG: hypothetical protein M3N12_04595 [Verrucomicrobiota bacterium]|nr:hypothetical protein [Verrucomicrobiota bacterium]